MKNLIEVKNIKKNYGKKEAVKGISFNVQENEILGLLGPNGSGKNYNYWNVAWFAKTYKWTNIY